MSLSHLSKNLSMLLNTRNGRSFTFPLSSPRLAPLINSTQTQTELVHSFSFQAAPVPLPGELSFTLVVGPVPATLRSRAPVSALLALSPPCHKKTLFCLTPFGQSSRGCWGRNPVWHIQYLQQQMFSVNEQYALLKAWIFFSRYSHRMHFQIILEFLT